MKKILLFALPLLAMCFASCEKDNGNNGGDEVELSGDDVIQSKDPNFLKALLVVQEIEIYDAETDDYIPYTMDVDKNKDGQITVNEAKDVKGLELFDHENEISFNITDMPEIKYFTSLEYLECGYNLLTTLDVSKNTALIELWCDGNQLTSLDVSNNAALTYLSCNGNQLTSLGLSKNPALTELYCINNQLTSLDLSQNTALIELECKDNQLTSLDVSKNTVLIDLECDNNQLTSLDLSKNPALKYLFCGNNPLTKITLYKYHTISNSYIEDIEEEYGNIIEYVE